MLGVHRLEGEVQGDALGRAGEIAEAGADVLPDDAALGQDVPAVGAVAGVKARRSRRGIAWADGSRLPTGVAPRSVVEVRARGRGPWRRCRHRSCRRPERCRHRHRRGASGRDDGRRRSAGRPARKVARSKARPRSWRSSSGGGSSCMGRACPCPAPNGRCGTWEVPGRPGTRRYNVGVKVHATHPVDPARRGGRAGHRSAAALISIRDEVVSTNVALLLVVVVVAVASVGQRLVAAGLPALVGRDRLQLLPHRRRTTRCGSTPRRRGDGGAAPAGGTGRG